MVNMSAKFDKEICNGLVSIVFTRSSHGRKDGSTDGTTAALLYPHRNALRGDNKSINIEKIIFSCLWKYDSQLQLKTYHSIIFSVTYTDLLLFVGMLDIKFSIWNYV